MSNEEKEKIIILFKKMEELIDFIQKELSIIEGDAYINEVMFNSFEGTDSESINKKLEIMQNYKHKEGMFDAYQKILKLLEIQSQLK